MTRHLECLIPQLQPLDRLRLHVGAEGGERGVVHLYDSLHRLPLLLLERGDQRRRVFVGFLQPRLLTLLRWWVKVRVRVRSER